MNHWDDVGPDTLDVGAAWAVLIILVAVCAANVACCALDRAGRPPVVRPAARAEPRGAVPGLADPYRAEPGGVTLTDGTYLTPQEWRCLHQDGCYVDVNAARKRGLERLAGEPRLSGRPLRVEHGGEE